jgi:hypothetical protein
MLRGAVGIFEAAVRGRIRGDDPFGSRTDGSAVTASDRGVFVAFREGFCDEEGRSERSGSGGRARN